MIKYCFHYRKLGDFGHRDDLGYPKKQMQFDLYCLTTKVFHEYISYCSREAILSTLCINGSDSSE